jgi:peptidoglycan/LPS O-acetylase OafA/YrhL
MAVLSVPLAEPAAPSISARPAAIAPRATYRPDIDGLRAIAVLFVVASHLHIPHLTGGYIGVDIFFVISGYLISSNILPQVRSGSFSLADFYVRRIRRIFPALIVMLAVTVPLAWRFLFPTEMVEFARSLLAAVFACSNTLLWSWGGYFSSENELKPLLHTWSLGVEEQFYLFFPLCLLALTRIRRHAWIRPFIWSLAIASFAAACFLVSRNPHAAFFNVSLRAWELMIGAILSQRYLPSPRRRISRELAAILGLVCIVLPALLYTANTTFPGLAALPPCIGAALLIAAGEQGASLPGRLLSLRPFVFFGLISYSLYLWHWPVQVFYNLRHLQTCAPGACAAPMGHTAQAFIFLVSVALATLSWRYVETPVRRRTAVFTPRRLVVASSFAAATVAACAIFLLATHGAPVRYTPDEVLAASQLGVDTYVPWRWGSCSLGLEHTSVDMYDQAHCLPFTPGKRHYLLLGDSHAAHLWPGFSTVFHDLQIGQATVAGCNLLPDKMSDSIPTCRNMATMVYRDLLPGNLSEGHSSQDPTEYPAGHPGNLSGERSAKQAEHIDTLIVSAQWHPYDLPAIGHLVTYARQNHIDVILIGPNIAYDLPLPRMLGALAAEGGLAVVQAHASPDLIQLDAQMAALARDQWKVPYISYFADMCSPTAGCSPYAAPGTPMLLDTNHFSTAGAVLFVQAMRDRHQIPK